MPAWAAAASAPSRILTKNGLVSVLVIRQALVASAGAAYSSASAVAPIRAFMEMVISYPPKDVLGVSPRSFGPAGIRPRRHRREEI